MTHAIHVLGQGRLLLDPVLTSHGFAWIPGASGSSSGGLFATGQYVRNNRRLELHVRHSLGLVSYHVGPHSVQHGDYMRVLLGPEAANQYPGFSEDPLEGFRHLAHDLGRFCGIFLSGSDEEFEAIVKQVEADAKVTGVKRLP